ncbi:MAG: SRPBCC family protein [Deltaproteobacteria bacterium]|nr:SRPBCC family protein [Deltaproteobacteria bacterium]
MSEATRSIEVNVPIEKMFDVITDYKAYPEFLGGLGMVGAEIDSDDGDIMVVTQSVKKMGKVISYTLRYKLERPYKVSWTMLKGQMMKDNRGSWVLEEAGEGRTKATYAAEIRFGMLVPKALIKILISKELPQMLESFKKRAESI